MTYEKFMDINRKYRMYSAKIITSISCVYLFLINVRKVARYTQHDCWPSRVSLKGEQQVDLFCQ